MTEIQILVSALVGLSLLSAIAATAYSGWIASTRPDGEGQQGGDKHPGGDQDPDPSPHPQGGQTLPNGDDAAFDTVDVGDSQETASEKAFRKAQRQTGQGF